MGYNWKKLAVAVLAALATGMTAAADLPPIRIGIVGPFSGKSSTDMGESMRGGARVFAEEVNALGGLLGRKIELVEKDDEAKPELGVKAARELIETDKVVATVGFANTGVALPSSKVFQDARIPLIVSGATGADVTRQYAPPKAPVSYIFRIAASDALQPIAILNDLIDRRGIREIALLHDESPYGMFGKANVVAELERRKLKPVAIESFKVGDQDMSAQLSRARDAGARAIMLYCLGTEAAMVAKSAAKIKFKVPMAGSWTLSQRAYLDLSGATGEGARTAVTYVEDELSSLRNAFSLSYKRVNKADRIPSAVAAAQTYDALRLLYLAIFQAGSTDGDAIRKALEDLKYPTQSTIVTRYDHPFTPSDHEAITLNMIVMGEIRNGKVVYAYPEDANSALIARVKTAQ